MKKKFAFTIGTIKEVCERCPNHDLDRLGELFSGTDYPATIDNMAWFICTLNKWAIFKETRSFDGAMTEDDVMAMDMPAIVEVYISFSYKLASIGAAFSEAFCAASCAAFPATTHFAVALFAATEAISASLHSPQSLRPYSGHMRLSMFE